MLSGFGYRHIALIRNNLSAPTYPYGGVKEHLYFADRLRYDYDTLTHHHLIRLSIISIMYKSSDERVGIFDSLTKGSLQKKKTRKVEIFQLRGGVVKFFDFSTF